ncbi:protein kinase [Agromyces sp. NPDC056523]|uniref:protein kinase domain-containing protein n=1 Tax=Agromyces sp. NPDC056523 TaxID=3345850 RepID=UPI00366A596C
MAAADRERLTEREDPSDLARDRGTTVEPHSRSKAAPGSADLDRATTAEPGSTPGRPRGRRKYTLPEHLVERYDYEADISAGSQAAVLLCRDRTTREHVAVKLYLDANGIIDPSVIDALADGDRRHIVPSRLEHADGEQWEIMEYFPLGSLQDLLGERAGTPQDTGLVRELVEELTEAVDYLHRMDIVHRDLKPGNVLVRSLEPLDLVIGDFGVSIQTSATAAATVRGTWAYSPPEAFFGEVSKRGDWWPVGMMAFELLMGHHLLADPSSGLTPNNENMRFMIGRGDFDLAAVSDPRWHLLLSGLLTGDAERRWGSAQVREWLAGGSPAVARSGSGPVWEARLPGIKPFFVGGVGYTDPVELSRAMVREWQWSVTKLAGRGIEELRTFLTEARVPDEVIASILARSSPSLTLLAMQGVFLPGAAPVFQGRSLDGETLTATALAAQAGDAGAGEWIREVRRLRVFGEAARYIDDDAALGWADELLSRWWDDVQFWRAALEQVPDVEPHLGSLRTSWEGTLLLAAFDEAAAASARSRAVREGERSTHIPEWTVALRDAARALDPDDAAGTGTAVVALSVLPVARDVETRRRNAEEEAERAQERAARAEEKRARAEQKRAMLADRRARNGPAFLKRLWAVGLFMLAAGALSAPSLFQGDSSGSTWDIARAAGVSAGASAVALSGVVFLWETFVAPVRLQARGTLLASGLIVSVALWWVQAVGWFPAVPVTSATWWITVPLVLGAFFGLAVALSAVFGGRPSLDQERTGNESLWHTSGPAHSTGMRHILSAVAVLAGVVSVGIGAELLYMSTSGQGAKSLVSTMAPPWAVDIGNRVDGVLPDLPMGGGPGEAFLIAVGACCATLVMTQLQHDLARRSAPLAIVAVVAAVVFGLYVVLASPWPLLLALTVVVVVGFGVIVVGLIAWFALSLLS